VAKQTSTGRCALCGGDFGKGGMTRHLTKCLAEHAPAKGKARDAVRLTVEGRYLPEYWLHLLMPADASLFDLDDFLRRIWLECCGHMSAFTIGGVRYELETGGVDQMWSMMFGRVESKSMETTLAEALPVGAKFTYEYDFGTTTDLAGKSIAHQPAVFGKKDMVRVLARNLPPIIPCSVCGSPSSVLCTECLYDGTGCLCEEHAESHACDEEMSLPVVNSPRVGQCAYTGPDDPKTYFNP
jgi:hypothetical protein